MPGMSGPELAKCLLALQPEVKVVYMSGYANDLIDQQGILDRDTVLLEKPFTLHALLTKAYQALHTEPSGKAAAGSHQGRFRHPVELGAQASIANVQPRL
jgi:CheY-like chemotaxis protein